MSLYTGVCMCLYTGAYRCVLKQMDNRDQQQLPFHTVLNFTFYIGSLTMPELTNSLESFVSYGSLHPLLGSCYKEAWPFLP